MAISQPNCNCQKVSKGPGPDLEPKWPFHSQIVIARRLQKHQCLKAGEGPFRAQGPRLKGSTYTVSAQSGMVPPQGWCQARGPLPGMGPPPLAARAFRKLLGSSLASSREGVDRL